MKSKLSKSIGIYSAACSLILSVCATSYAQDIPTVTQEATSVEQEFPRQPMMTEFFLECMKNGGTPGQADDPERDKTYFSGREYLFNIWTPQTQPSSGGIIVTHYVRVGPNLKQERNVHVRSGHSFSLVTDKLEIKSGNPRGNRIPNEYCVRQQPVVALSQQQQQQQTNP